MEWEIELTDVAGDLDQLAINTIRTLSMDAVQKANSGHPGAPMGMAPMAYTLWTQFLRHAPADPSWPNRPAGPGFVGRSDRFDSPSYRPWAV